MTEFEWMEACANNGVLHCQFQVGVMYESGKEVPKNVEKGIVYLKMASDQGAALASYWLSLIYAGRGDFYNDFLWLQKAAEQGLANAQAMVAVYYTNGKIIPKDDIKACIWLTVANANDPTVGIDHLQKIMVNLTPVEQAEVHKIANEKLSKLPRMSLSEHQDVVSM